MDDKLSTRHGEFRLMQRAQQFDKTMTELWDEGIECEIKYASYDEARVVPSEQVALLMKGGQIVTIYDDLHNVTVEDKDFQEFLGDSIE